MYGSQPYVPCGTPTVYFDENQEGEALERQQQTKLTAWFEFNKKAIAEGAEPGTLPRYLDMPKEHVYDKKLKIWKKKDKDKPVM